MPFSKKNPDFDKFMEQGLGKVISGLRSNQVSFSMDPQFHGRFCEFNFPSTSTNVIPDLELLAETIPSGSSSPSGSLFKDIHQTQAGFDTEAYRKQFTARYSSTNFVELVESGSSRSSRSLEFPRLSGCVGFTGIAGSSRQNCIPEPLIEPLEVTVSSVSEEPTVVGESVRLPLVPGFQSLLKDNFEGGLLSNTQYFNRPVRPQTALRNFSTSDKLSGGMQIVLPPIRVFSSKK